MRFNRPKYYIITGIFSILPIAATYWIVLSLFKFFSNPGVKIVQYIFDENIPIFVPEITGFILTLLFIYLIGLFISNVIGKNIYTWFEKILSKLPFINVIYRTIKQIIVTLSQPNSYAFKKVVYIEYPRVGIWTLAMLTGESTNNFGDNFYHIFVPTTPNPTSGYLLYLPKSDVQLTDITIEEGMKIIISGGMLASKINQLRKINASKSGP